MTGLSNREIFTRMLDALGRQDWDGFEKYLADDLLAEWPYVVVPGFPTEMVGRKPFREALEGGMKAFAPYAYRILEIYELKNPNQLIAEYTSHSRYLARGTPYNNRYVGIVDFANGLITRWREYVNPLIVREAMGPDYDRLFPSS
jgi:ketosteroid isomerase-like protein